MLTILNSPVLTDYGSFLFQPITLKDARRRVRESDWESAVGHEETARVISELLQIRCAKNRISYHQQVGDSALVFSLKARPPEGRILSRQEIEQVGYSWGLLVRHQESSCA